MQALILVLSAFDRSPGTFHVEIILEKARRILTLAAGVIASRLGRPATRDVLTLNMCQRDIVSLLYDNLLGDRGDVGLRSILNAILVLSIDHDFSAPTLAVRIAASGRTSLYNSLLAGLSSLCGSSHLRSVEAVIQMLRAVEGSNPPLYLSDNWLSRHEVRQSFGHRLYPGGDPRAKIVLDQLLAKASPSVRKTNLIQVIDAIRRAKLQPPNLSFALAAFSYLGNLDDGAAVALFGLARIVGWVAHYVEEHGEAPERFATRSSFRVGV